MKLQGRACRSPSTAAAATTAVAATRLWPLPPAACIANNRQGTNSRRFLVSQGAAAPAPRRAPQQQQHHHRVASLPEDRHHSPQETTPEAWLVAQQQQQHAKQAQPHESHGHKLRVPYLDVDFTPDLVAISMVYFVQGILGLSQLALSFFFKDDLGVEPAQVAVLIGVSRLPWVIKPLYGFISDSIPLFGYRRRSYLLLCGLAGTASWLSLAFLVHSPTAAVCAMLLGSLGTACSDVVVDSLVVARAREESPATAGSLQSLCWGSSAVGGIMSAYFSGSLVEQYGSQTVFLLTAVFPLIVSASALLIDEQRVNVKQLPAAAAAGAGAGPAAGVAVDAEQWQQPQKQQQKQQHQQEWPQQEEHHLITSSSLSTGSSSSSSSSEGNVLLQQVVQQGGALWGAIKQKHILLPTVFVFLWQATPTADTAMFYFYTNHLHFSPEFLGRVSLAGSVASLAGVALYNGVFKEVPLKKMLLGAMLLGVGLGSTQLLLVSGVNRALGLSDELFVLGDSVILTVLGQVSFMPILVLAARLCPEGVEATLFATLMSILNGGSFVGSALGAGLTAYLGVTSTDFSNMFVLVALCTFSTLMPAPFLSLLPSSLDEDSSPAAVEAAAGDGSSGGGSGDSSGVPLKAREGGKQVIQLPAAVQAAGSDGSSAAAAATNGRRRSDAGDEQQAPLQRGDRK